MRRRLTATACVALLAAPLAWAESDDFGTGLSLEAKTDITQRIEASVEGEVRTSDGMADIERWAFGIGASCQLTSWAEAGAGYTLIARRKDLAERLDKDYHQPAYWSPRHRAYAGLQFRWKPFGHWTLSLRERYQYTNAPRQYVRRYSLTDGHRMTDGDKEDFTDHILRSRVQARWKRKRSPWSPFASVEMLNMLDGAMALDQMRYMAGLGYRINKHNSISLQYRYKDRSDSDEVGGHLVTLGYTLSL